MTDAETAALAASILDNWHRAHIDPKRWERTYNRHADMRLKLAHEFGRRMGWTWRQQDYSAQELHGKRPGWAFRDLPPHHDHGSGYRIGRRPAATVIQPYDVDEAAKSDMQKWAIQRGLILLLPDFPSWWLPTHTTLCIFAVPGAMPT